MITSFGETKYSAWHKTQSNLEHPLKHWYGSWYGWISKAMNFAYAKLPLPALVAYSAHRQPKFVIQISAYYQYVVAHYYRLQVEI